MFQNLFFDFFFIDFATPVRRWEVTALPMPMNDIIKT
jgi:hypothetical protein